MNSRERVLASLERTGYDRIPIKHEGTPEVNQKLEVRRRLDLFGDGGLFLGPTHAIQLGSPIENALAMYRAAGSLREEIDESILSIEADEDAVDKIDMEKLY